MDIKVRLCSYISLLSLSILSIPYICSATNLNNVSVVNIEYTYQHTVNGSNLHTEYVNDLNLPESCIDPRTYNPFGGFAVYSSTDINTGNATFNGNVVTSCSSQNNTQNITLYDWGCDTCSGTTAYTNPYNCTTHTMTQDEYIYLHVGTQANVDEESLSVDEIALCNHCALGATPGTFTSNSTHEISDATFALNTQAPFRGKLVVQGFLSFQDVSDAQPTNFIISDVKPNVLSVEYSDTRSWRGNVNWKIPFAVGAGEAMTILPSVTSGYGSLRVDSVSTEPCTSISQFRASNSTVDPISGGMANFLADVGTSDWSLSVAGRSYQGHGAVNVTWDGKNENGEAVADGTYAATLTLIDGACSDTETIYVEVKRCKESCLLKVPLGSSVNVASGGLTDQRLLFSLKGGPIPTEVSLYYNSLEQNKVGVTPLLSEYYHRKLQDNGDGTISFIELNNTRIYTWSGTEYVSPQGDESILNKNADNTFTVTESNGAINSFNADGSIASVENDLIKYTIMHSNGTPSTITSWSYSLTKGWQKGDSLILSSLFDYSKANAFVSSLGGGWSHSYEIILQDQGNDTILFRNGNTTRTYVLSGAIYISNNNDKSTLVKNTDGSYVVSETDGVKHNFNQAGRITSHVDRIGNTVAFQYSAGNLTSIIDTLGRTINFTYDTAKKLVAISDPKGNSYTFAYTSGLLTEASNPDDTSWDYTYDTAGFLLTKTDPNSNATTYTYDNNHRILSSHDPEGKVRDLSYPPNGSFDPTNKQYITTFKEKDGGNWQYRYDISTGRVISKTDPLGYQTYYFYDAKGNMLSMTEPWSRTTSYLYDNSDRVIQETDPLGNITTYTYNDYDQLLTITSPMGTVTSIYDSVGNLVSTTDVAGATANYEYDTKKQLIKITNAGNQITQFAYDPSGYLTTVTDSTGAASSFTYDACGNMITSTDSTSKTTSYEYDSRNRLSRITDPLGNITIYSYDGIGNLLSITDANNNTTTYAYNYRGQVIQIKDTLNNLTSFGYGATGCSSCSGGIDKLTSLTDATGHATSWQYDLVGRITQETDPLQKTTAYGYDAAGNMTAKTDANGASLSLVYDKLKRLTRKTYPDGSRLDYTYDAAGRVLTATNGSISYIYTYDNGGRVIRVADSRGYVITYEYDILGNRTKMTLQPGTADEKVTTYGYDNGNRITGITSSSGTFTYGYDVAGRRSSLSYPNSVTASYGYDDAGRLTSLVHSATSSNIASYTYTLDKVGNRTTRATTELEQYLYDTIYRLLTVTSARPEAFTFDAVGNRQSGPGAKDTGYQHDAGNRMTKGRKLLYGYDNNGNLTTRTVTAATDKSWTHRWDYENRLVKVEKMKGAEKRTVTFTYDAFGRRFGKQMTVMKGGMTKTSSWSYVYDNDNIVLELFTDETGTITKTYYSHGPGTDEQLAMERSGQFYYYHADGLGSITAITDINQQKLQSYSYDSYGMITPQTGFANSYTYTGREWDKETGLYFYKARYYDPLEGRFISRDPIGFRGGINLYNYVDSNPVNYTDPFGLTKVIYLPPDDPNYPAAVQRPDVSGVCTVISHGSSSSVSGMNAKSLNNALSRDCGKDEPVVLDACNTGRGNNSIAEQLAKLRGTNVTAPDNIIWTTPWNTELSDPYPPMSTNRNSLFNNIPDLRYPGNWNTFKP